MGLTDVLAEFPLDYLQLAMSGRIQSIS